MEWSGPLNYTVVNEKFGAYVVLKKSWKRRKRQTLWESKCECGNILDLSFDELVKKDQTQGCDCEVSKSLKN